jgi:hypothetical protein
MTAKTDKMLQCSKQDDHADAICFMLANAAVSGELWADAGWHAPAWLSLP